MIQTHVWFDQSLYPSRPELVAACVPGEEGRRGRERAAPQLRPRARARESSSRRARVPLRLKSAMSPREKRAAVKVCVHTTCGRARGGGSESFISPEAVWGEGVCGRDTWNAAIPSVSAP